MAPNRYRFVTHWRVDAPPEEVFAVLTDSKSLSRWWPSVYRDVEQLAPPRGPDGIGKALRLHTQGWLPYRLCWELRVVEYEPPERLAFVARGDFVGEGAWTFRKQEGVTEVAYHWDVRAEKPLLRRLSFLLKPIFTLNHRWAMARGLESLRLELERRRGVDASLPPGPVTALRSWSFIVLVLMAVGAAATMLVR